MGITGLYALCQASEALKKIKLSDLNGKTVAIDASMWLYRGARSDKDDFNKKPPTPDSKYIGFVFRKIDQLLKENVKLILVFDGQRLPIKQTKNEKRNRDNINITSNDAFVFIQALKKKEYENVEFIVAPYEADAQLAYLANHEDKDVYAVLTTDSDFIPLKCPRIIFVNDEDPQLFELEMRHLLKKFPNSKNEEEKKIVYDFSQFTDDMFLEMCILCGCDYFKLSNTGGLGIAYKLIKKHQRGTKVLEELLQEQTPLNLDLKRGFINAFVAFKFQYVYNQESGELEHMSQPTPSDRQYLRDPETGLEFDITKYTDATGKPLSANIAKERAEGTTLTPDIEEETVDKETT